MEINGRQRSDSRVRGIPSKPLDNPLRPKPTYASDAECARLLEVVLAEVPSHLGYDRRSPFPLTDALVEVDAALGTGLARQLVFIAAAIHQTADERRTAEYLLRSRDAVVAGRRSALALLTATRCAAEMDVRRVHLREAPIPQEILATWASEEAKPRIDEPSVGEMVLDKLHAATGYEPSNPFGTNRILDAVAIALELAERHALNGGRGPSLLAMRSDARKEARLATHLRRAFANDDACARGVARLLVGADGTPIETALLWWSALPVAAVVDIPPSVRQRWVRYARTADADVAFAALPDRVDTSTKLSGSPAVSVGGRARLEAEHAVLCLGF